MFWKLKEIKYEQVIKPKTRYFLKYQINYNLLCWMGVEGDADKLHVDGKTSLVRHT